MPRNGFTLLAAATVVGLALSSSTARADGYEHSGFQFRAAVGVGYLSDAESQNATLHGGAGNLEIYLGGSPARGLTIGGFASGATAVGPSVSFSDSGVVASDSNTTLTLFTLGPYIDYYPHPHRGFHIMGTVGFAQLTASYNDGNVTASNAANGFTLGGGIGYDWWVDSNWSIGVLGRFTFASTSRTIGDGVSVSEDTIMPAVLFSVSFN